MQEDLNQRLIEHLQSRQRTEDGDHEPLKNGEFFAYKAGLCPRKVQDIIKNKRKAAPEALKVMLTGKLIHDYVQQNVMGGYQHEVPLQHKVGPLTIRARLDSENEVEVAEVKSTGWMPKEPLSHHRAQLSIYMIDRQKNGRLIYIERAKFNIKEFTFTLEEMRPDYEDTIKRFQMVYDAEQKGELAEAIPIKWECGYCEMENCDKRCSPMTRATQ